MSTADYFVITILRIYMDNNTKIDIELDYKNGYYEIYPGLFTTKYHIDSEEYWDSRRDWYDQKLKLLNKTILLYDKKTWISQEYKKIFNDQIINELLKKQLTINNVTKIIKIIYVE